MFMYKFLKNFNEIACLRIVKDFLFFFFFGFSIGSIWFESIFAACSLLFNFFSSLVVVYANLFTLNAKLNIEYDKTINKTRFLCTFTLRCIYRAKNNNRSMMSEI